jgi:arabinofuranosyltransferase
MRAAAVAEANPPKPRFEPVALALLVALVALLAVKCAWVCDDAYITFRVVDNVLDGYGPRWNVAERVQAYTHPLWMLAMCAASALTGEVYLTSVVLGVALTVAAASWLALAGARDLAGAVFALLVLASSKAFVDFSTSGLENPLQHVALVGALVAFTASAPPAKRALGLALASSAVALTRLDGLLLVLPLVATHAWVHRGRALWARIALGFLPLAAWELVSLAYYGFLLPNTAYAKLSTGIPQAELALQGLRYLGDSLRRDPVTLPVIVLAVGVAALRRERALLAVAAGIVLHLAYVVRIGGDFMSGRFLTPPLVAAAFLLAHARLPAPALALGSLAALALAVASPASPLRAPLDYPAGRAQTEFLGPDGICDERGYWYGYAGLFSRGQGPQELHVRRGHPLASTWRAAAPTVQVAKGIGYIGYWAGPLVHIVDPMGLSDALLARLPVVEDGVVAAADDNRFRDRPWRIGHFHRAIPAGYLESLRDPSARIADPAIAALRADLDLITRGETWSAARWRAIARRLF